MVVLLVYMKPEVIDILHRRRFLIPNAVTLANLFCGFIAIIYATSGRFEKASIAIFLAIVLDGLDGRLARRFNATSKFGVEFDSLSDFISFGVAPAILIYNWCFRLPADEFGVTVTFLYCLCAASRLARFNITEPGTKNFEGCPTPGAASVIAALVNFSPTASSGYLPIALATVVMVGLSYLMVSKVEFLSIKRLRIGKVNKLITVLIGITIALLWYDSGKGLLILSLAYVLSGPISYIWRKKSALREPKASTAQD